MVNRDGAVSGKRGASMKRSEESLWSKSGARAAIQAINPARFIKQHVAPLLYEKTRPPRGKSARDKSFPNDEAFWKSASGSVFSSVTLVDFKLTEWFPRAPGVYWSEHGIQARRYAEDRDGIDDPELGRIVRPRSKMDLVEEGGLGTIRLRPRRIDSTDYWLTTAVTGIQCAGGVPVAVPDGLVARGSVGWRDTVTIVGKVRFLEDLGLEDPARSVHHASPLIVVAETIERSPRSRQNREPLLLTPVVLFSDVKANRARIRDHDWGGEFGYTFVHVPEEGAGDMGMAEEWLSKYAAKFGGRIITNFDQQRPHLSDAPLSYQRLVAGTYDRTIIEHIEHLHFEGAKLADRIDRVGDVMSVNVTLGDGTVVHGDFVIAGSISESFNRAKQVVGDEHLRELLQRLASQVGAILEKLEHDYRLKPVDSLPTESRAAAEAA